MNIRIGACAKCGGNMACCSCRSNELFEKALKPLKEAMATRNLKEQEKKMGAEYALVKDDKKEYFELGKGAWQEVFCLSDDYAVYEKRPLTSMFTSLISFLNLLSIHKPHCVYANNIEEAAALIWKWAGADPIRMVSDGNSNAFWRTEYLDCHSSECEIRPILTEVLDEILRAERKHGPQPNHSPCRWMSIVNEEAGEATRAEVNAFMALRSGAPGIARNELLSHRKELIQTAAMAVQAVRHFDKGIGLKDTDLKEGDL